MDISQAGPYGISNDRSSPNDKWSRMRPEIWCGDNVDKIISCCNVESSLYSCSSIIRDIHFNTCSGDQAYHICSSRNSEDRVHEYCSCCNGSVSAGKAPEVTPLQHPDDLSYRYVVATGIPCISASRKRLRVWCHWIPHNTEKEMANIKSESCCCKMKCSCSVDGGFAIDPFTLTTIVINDIHADGASSRQISSILFGPRAWLSNIPFLLVVVVLRPSFWLWLCRALFFEGIARSATMPTMFPNMIAWTQQSTNIGDDDNTNEEVWPPRCETEAASHNQTWQQSRSLFPPLDCKERSIKIDAVAISTSVTSERILPSTILCV